MNLTTMLVLTTIFISKMESLPSTSDIRMIDVWLILCQLLPFLEVVLLTAMEFFRELQMTGKEQTNEKKENTSKEISRNEHYINVLKFVGEQSLLEHCVCLIICSSFRCQRGQCSVAHFCRGQLCHVHWIGDNVSLLYLTGAYGCIWVHMGALFFMIHGLSVTEEKSVGSAVLNLTTLNTMTAENLTRWRTL